LENLEKHQQFNTGIVANETQACKWFQKFYKIKATDDKAQKTKLLALQEGIQKEIAVNKNRSLLAKLIVEACQ
jgi:DNA-directed RNA polymerase subunit F